MKKAYRIFVAGGGASATLLLACVLRQQHTPLHLIVADRSGAFARGVSYGTTHPEHVLNVAAKNMSAFAGEPDHFINWLSAHHPGYNENDFVPRKLYGDYLEEVLNQSVLLGRANGHVIEFLHTNVIDIDPIDHAACVVTTKMGRHTADAFVLATGNAVPQNIPQDRNGTYPSAYAADYVQLKNLPHVMILGTGLGMVDAVLSLQNAQFAGKITAVSRHGLLPAGHCAYEPFPAFAASDYPMRLLDVARTIRQRAQNEQARGKPWQSVVDSLRANANNIWHDLVPAQQAGFKRLRPFWNVHRHRVAPAVRQTLDGLVYDGNLVIVKGKVKNVTEQNGTFFVETKRETFATAAVINCLGYDYRANHPACLASRLIAKKMAFEKNGNLQTMEKNSSRLSRDNAVYALGPVLSGFHFETTAMREIREQAQFSSVEILKDAQNSVSFY